jgi:hypothetical protein
MTPSFFVETTKKFIPKLRNAGKQLLVRTTIALDWKTSAASPRLKPEGAQSQPTKRKTVGPSIKKFLDGAGKLVSHGGYNLAAVAKAVDVP